MSSSSPQPLDFKAALLFSSNMLAAAKKNLQAPPAPSSSSLASPLPPRQHRASMPLSPMSRYMSPIENPSSSVVAPASPSPSTISVTTTDPLLFSRNLMQSISPTQLVSSATTKFNGVAHGVENVFAHGISDAMHTLNDVENVVAHGLSHGVSGARHTLTEIENIVRLKSSVIAKMADDNNSSDEDEDDDDDHYSMLNSYHLDSTNDMDVNIEKTSLTFSSSKKTTENVCDVYKFEDNAFNKKSNMPMIMYNLLTENREKPLPPPGNVISVIGDSRHSTVLRPRCFEEFSKDLCEAAEATNAWFLTFGSDVGIASTIGRLREARGSSFPMIGICDYKHMKYSEFIQFTKLEMDAKSGSGGGGGSNSMDSPAKQPKTKNELWDEVEARATMKCNRNVEIANDQKKRKNFDDNHSHLLLAVDTSAFNFSINFQQFIVKGQFEELTSRQYLHEKEIAKKAKEKSFSYTNLEGDELDSGSTPFEPNSQGKQYIPSVCFVFGGSFNAIEKAYRMMKNDTPLVLVEGSKGFATEMKLWLQYYQEDVNHKDYSEKKNKILMDRLVHYFMNKSRSISPEEKDPEIHKAKIVEMVNMHRNCETLIYVYDLSSRGSTPAERDDIKSRSTVTSLRNRQQLSILDSLKLNDNHDGTLREIFDKVLLDNGDLSMKSKLFLSIKWNSAKNLRMLLSQLPLDSVETNKSVDYLFEGESAAYAAFHDQSDVLQQLYDFGCKNEYLDVLIGYELGFLHCTNNHSKTIDSKIQKPEFSSPKSRPSILLAERDKSNKIEIAKLKHESSCPALLLEGEDNILSAMSGSFSAPDKVRHALLSFLKSAVIHVGDPTLDMDDDVNEFVQKREISWDEINFLVDHERDNHDIKTEEGKWEPKARTVDKKGNSMSGSDDLNREFLLRVLKLEETGLPFCSARDLNFSRKKVKSAFYEQYDMRKRMIDEKTGKLVGSDDKKNFMSWDGSPETLSSTKLTHLHRAWWALITRRHKIVKVFVKQSPMKIATALVIAGAYREMAADDKMNETVLLEYASEYDAMALSLMDEIDEAEAMTILPIHQYWGGVEKRFDVDEFRDQIDQRRARANITMGKSLMIDKLVERATFAASGLDQGIMNEATAEEIKNILASLPFDPYLMDQDVFYCKNKHPLTSSHLHQKTFLSSVSDVYMYSNGFRLMGDYDGGQTLIDLALITKNKKFISHNHVQSFLDSLWMRPCGESDEFEPKQTKRALLVRFPLMCKQKMLYSVVFDLVWMAMYTQFITGELFTNKLFSNFEKVFWFYVVGFVWEELEQIRSTNFHEYLRGAHNLQDSSIAVLCTFSFVLRVSLVLLWVDDPMLRNVFKDFSRIFLSISYILVSTRVLEKLSFVKRVGVLMVMMKRMLVNDVTPYLMFCSALIACTGFAMNGMFGIPIWNTFLMFLGDWGWEDFEDEYVQKFSEEGMMYTTNVTNSSSRLLQTIDEVASMGYDEANVLWKRLAQLLFVLYIITTNIVLVNLLIAQMSDTYAKIMEEADEEWKFIRGSIIKDVYHSSMLPPPLNLINAIGAGLNGAIHGCLGAKHMFWNLELYAERAYARPTKSAKWVKGVGRGGGLWKIPKRKVDRRGGKKKRWGLLLSRKGHDEEIVKWGKNYFCYERRGDKEGEGGGKKKGGGNILGIGARGDVEETKGRKAREDSHRRSFSDKRGGK